MNRADNTFSVVKTRLVNDDIWYHSFNGTVTNLRDLLDDPEKYLGIAFDPYSPITITFVYTLEGNDEDGLRETYVAEGVLGTNFITVNCPFPLPLDRYADIDRELEDYLQIPTDSAIDVKWVDTPKVAYAHYDPKTKSVGGDAQLGLLENTAQLIRRPELLPPFLSRREVRGKFVQNRLDPSSETWAVTDIAKDNIKVAFEFPQLNKNSFRFVYQTKPKILCISEQGLGGYFRMLINYLTEKISEYDGLGIDSAYVGLLYEFETHDEYMECLSRFEKEYGSRTERLYNFDGIKTYNSIATDFRKHFSRSVKGICESHSDFIVSDPIECVKIFILKLVYSYAVESGYLESDMWDYLTAEMRNDNSLTRFMRDMIDDIDYLLGKINNNYGKIFEYLTCARNNFIILSDPEKASISKNHSDNSRLIMTSNMLTETECIKVTGTYLIDNGINLLTITVTEATQFRWYGAILISEEG